MKRGVLILVAVLALTSPLRADETTGSVYHQIASVSLPGDDRWDYLAIDPAAHRLYVTRATHVTVFDTNSNSVVGDIPNTQGVHGVALAPQLAKAFISNGKDNSLSIIDLSTLKEIARLPVGKNPDAILFEPSTNRVFAFNGKDGTATVIDALKDRVLNTILIGGKLEFATADGHGMVFDNVEDKNEIVAIDAAQMKIAHRWPIAGCDSPTGLAMDTANNRLFAACDNGKLAVVDALTGKIVATPSIGNGPDAVAFDRQSQIIYVPNGEDGTLSLIRELSPDTYGDAGRVPTEIGARTLALDRTTRRVYTITAKFGDTPQPTADTPHPRPSIVPGSVVLLVYGPTNG